MKINIALTICASIFLITQCSNKETEDIVFNYIGGLDNAILTALKNSNFRNGIQDASDYAPHAGSHPLIILNEQGSLHVYTDLLPMNLIPKTISELEIVVVLHDQVQQEIETCSYTSGYSLSRCRYQRGMDFYSAKSGQKFFDYTIWGDDPETCPLSLTTGSDKNITWNGSAVSASEIIAYLSSQYN
jgi:hypothetical protein